MIGEITAELDMCGIALYVKSFILGTRSLCQRPFSGAGSTEHTLTAERARMLSFLDGDLCNDASHNARSYSSRNHLSTSHQRVGQDERKSVIV